MPLKYQFPHLFYHSTAAKGNFEVYYCASQKEVRNTIFTLSCGTNMPSIIKAAVK